MHLISIFTFRSGPWPSLLWPASCQQLLCLEYPTKTISSVPSSSSSTSPTASLLQLLFTGSCRYFIIYELQVLTRFVLWPTSAIDLESNHITCLLFYLSSVPRKKIWEVCAAFGIDRLLSPDDSLHGDSFVRTGLGF